MGKCLDYPTVCDMFWYTLAYDEESVLMIKIYKYFIGDITQKCNWVSQDRLEY